MNPYRQRGFHNLGKKTNDRSTESNRLEAGGLNTLGENLNIQTIVVVFA
tara:strand:- start:233 stop:379 length:147 start_codon:yes stop_codon:yes gene_type:complete